MQAFFLNLAVLLFGLFKYFSIFVRLFLKKSDIIRNIYNKSYECAHLIIRNGQRLNI